MQQKIQGDPMVSIIIPSKDHIDDLKKCVESLYKVNTWKNFEVIIVENNSDKQETFDYYKKIEKKYPNLKVLYWKDEFNYSAINNFGEKEAKGDYILLLNNDTEILEPDSIKEMVRRAQMTIVGAVGAKLYYPDDTIQHYGVTIGIGGVAGHPFSREQDKNLDNYLKISVHNVSAATAACLLIPKAVFDEINGLDEKLKVAFNDVDLCLRIRQKGYWIVQTPHAKLYHYESKSRGQDISEENRKRFDSEKRFMMDRWGKEILGGDPFYNRNFSYYGGEHLLRQKDEIHPAVHLQHYLEELDAKEKQENQSE
jgi:GT2 family glycosyltransferase